MPFYEKNGIISTETKFVTTYVDFKDTADLNKQLTELRKKGTDKDVYHDSNRIAIYDKIDQDEYNLKGNTVVLRQGGYPLPSQYMKEITLKDTEELLFLSESYTEIENYIKNVLTSRKIYSDDNLFYKAGVLLYGPPGNGKTSLIRYMVNKLFPEDSMKIWCNTIPDIDMINEFKKIDKLKVFIFEELTTSLDNHGSIKRFLEFMDGESSIENSIVIATTNYPEALPANVVDRKGRFDVIKKIDNPSDADRDQIINHYFKTSNEEMVNMTKDMTFADIKEIYLLNKVHGLDFEAAVKDLKDHKELVNNTFAEKRKLGF